MSKSDLELLELAARAAGIDGTWTYGADFEVSPPIKTEAYWLSDESGHWLREWNPLTDDRDALRLAVKLGITIGPSTGRPDYCIAEGKSRRGVTPYFMEAYCDDPNAATRRAIVRAAAEIGRSMP